MDGLGRRERKRQQTRDLIAQTARALFAERGFDGVTVAEIAEAADVSEQTVYNHFPTKEDLVLWRRGTFEAGLLEAVRDRPPGESAVAAFRRFLTRPHSMDPEAGDPMSAQTAMSDDVRLILDSPSLRARERSIVAAHTELLAAVLAEETGAGADDVEPLVAAAAMYGAAQAVIRFARRRVIEGARTPQLTRDIRRCADRAAEMLEHGLAGYATKADE